MSRTFRTRDVEELAKERGVLVHRELLAEISDRYGWAYRGDTARGKNTGPRRWNEAEALAMISIVLLRRAGLSWEQIDDGITAGPEGLIDSFAATVTERLSDVAKVSNAA